MKRLSRGFSLIELLIVVSIIIILITIAVSSYSGFQKNSRDVKRQTDLKIIQSALEQYHADQSYYASNSAMVAATLSGLTSGLKTYLRVFPKDPKADSDLTFKYLYEASPSGCQNDPVLKNYCTGYRMCAKLETTPSGSICSFDGSLNYEVTPQL
ncbi:MAG: Type II secretion system protein G [Candidatus Daviesbacteria bacterium GW2011_GWA1_41_61]|uniref:Type II secretion system protein G n=1 Tax=Candidatus Daviesbacteria bacterium GW2011_GWA2_40_9 TaxID=1618424 RepID=A0A0G0X864_9BACT|nr:MAG: seg [Candidatus Daviesbacteria bacterium GW2011_GWC1_40_9]KKR83852.1 MAG: Type II secretion system protein G [Candidatus Daviesbacteria bacterium GW2011_GWA2_40_9]KKR93461.1 MAG: Type II secretion system protein G [Candidatus Daviesbacteria bacterium GW2011_GWB1_41_15]KKS14990.1 MAG: Type II secretion system protein G [Candidatus Daviesbacteria bacterium GW2011_GWA1_41_61]